MIFERKYGEMLNLDKNKFSYVFFDNMDEFGFVGKIIHPDMKNIIFVRPKSIPNFEEKILFLCN